MRLLFDFFPIFLFFLSYKFFGIYIATGVTMAASLLQIALYWFKNHRFETLHIITLALVILLGSATLWLHNPLFIKWKPTAIYWSFALAFLFSQFLGHKPLIQRMMDDKFTVPRPIWQRLNISWIIFFGLMGLVNLWVVYHFSTNTWVYFKFLGTLGLTLLFVMIQAVYLSRYIHEEESLSSEQAN